MNSPNITRHIFVYYLQDDQSKDRQGHERKHSCQILVHFSLLDGQQNMA